MDSSRTAQGVPGFFGVQLFRAGPDGTYDEAGSARAQAKIGVDPQELRLQLPDAPTAPSGLRFDVADRPGFLRLYSVSLVEKGGTPLWHWSGDALSINRTLSQQLIELSANDRRWWLSTGDDPFVVLPIPKELLARAGGATLEVTLGWPSQETVAPDVAARLDSFETEKARLERALASNGEQLLRLERLVAQLKRDERDAAQINAAANSERLAFASKVDAFERRIADRAPVVEKALDEINGSVVELKLRLAAASQEEALSRQALEERLESIEKRWASDEGARSRRMLASKETTRSHRALERRLEEAERRADTLLAMLSNTDARGEVAMSTALAVKARTLVLEEREARRPAPEFWLQPLNQICASPKGDWQWEATGNDAQFVLHGARKRGWYRIAWRGRADTRVPLKLYVDYGQGFSEEHTLVFGDLDLQTERQEQYVPIAEDARALRIDVADNPAHLDLILEDWRRIASLPLHLRTLARLLRRPGGWRSLVRAFRELGLRGGWRALRRELFYGRALSVPRPTLPFHAHPFSEEWTRRGPPAPQRATPEAAAAAIDELAHRPLVSIIVPCYNTPPDLLNEAVRSVEGQLYSNWELLLVDDGSPKEATRAALAQLEGSDPRIQVLWQPKNAGISAATNAGLQAAKGELVALLDHDDTLTSDALFEVVRRFSQEPELDAVYTDQDKIDERGRPYETFYKPDWSPELLRGVMYVGHLLVCRRSLMLELKGFDSRFDKVQDFEFMLRLSERTHRVGHIPLVLYHWRAVPGSVARGAAEKSGIAELQASAVRTHLERVNANAVVEPHPKHDHRVVVKPKPAAAWPLVSIIIPSKDAPQHITRCLKSIYQLTTYPRFEVILVDNGTTNEDALAAIASHPVEVVPYNETFNFSIANNRGAERARGEILVLLNNDTEVVDPDWLQTMVFHLQQPNVGMVGPLLLFPNGTVQHAGVVLGYRGTADHVMRGFPGDADGYAGSLTCAREVSGVTGACLMIRSADYRRLGGLVEHYGSIYQDVDLCLRVRQEGKRILFVAQTQLIHHESATRGSAYDRLDRALLLDTWGETIARGDPYHNRNFSLDHHDYTSRSDATP